MTEEGVGPCVVCVSMCMHVHVHRRWEGVGGDAYCDSLEGLKHIPSCTQECGCIARYVRTYVHTLIGLHIRPYVHTVIHTGHEWSPDFHTM